MTAGAQRGTVRLRSLALGVSLLQRVLPPRGDQVAWSSRPDVSDSALHLYRHLRAVRPDLRHVWLVAAPDDGGDDRTRYVRRSSVRGYWQLLRSRWVVHTHGLHPAIRSAHRRQIVSLWHGMQIKQVALLDRSWRGDPPAFGSVHVATSSFFQELASAAFGVPRERVLLTALPRSDVLARPIAGAPDPAAVRDALGLPHGARVVFWLPTFRDAAQNVVRESGVLGPRSFFDDLEPGALDALLGAARAHGCHVVVKLHPLDPLNEVAVDVPGLHVVGAAAWAATGLDLYDALAATDGLISDVSSVVVDYLASTKPLGLFGFDPDRYQRSLSFPVERLLRSDRIADLADAEERDAFFATASRGAPGGPDDLSPWLHEAPAGRGCETVQAAIGL